MKNRTDDVTDVFCLFVCVFFIATVVVFVCLFFLFFVLIRERNWSFWDKLKLRGKDYNILLNFNFKGGKLIENQERIFKTV